MKMILFLVAVYALIINQYYQKKITTRPQPAPIPRQETMTTRDTSRTKADYKLIPETLLYTAIK